MHTTRATPAARAYWGVAGLHMLVALYLIAHGMYGRGTVFALWITPLGPVYWLVAAGWVAAAAHAARPRRWLVIPVVMAGTSALPFGVAAAIYLAGTLLGHPPIVCASTDGGTCETLSPSGALLAVGATATMGLCATATLALGLAARSAAER